MILIEKYDPEKVFTVVHFDGKSKNYLVKRFAFENTPPGKETSIISDENGSKLVFISGAAQPVVKVEQLKGKEQTTETVELDLSTVIDVKGMKAMGNRLSQHPIKKVELIAEIDAEEEVVIDDAEQDDSAIEPIETDEPQDTSDTPPQVDETIKPSGRSEHTPEQSVESTEEPVQSPPKKIDFEITNPDDIEIDDKGQLGLF